ncbi:hypothetical protein J3P75_22865 [Pseudomonas sp. R1-1]|uniref:hypothetical protein n=1 Tax=Pseudomonas sp. R1-1 TaxID=1602529 RepID=UPI003DA9F2CA
MNKVRINSQSKKNVTGVADVEVTGLELFKGNVLTFSTDGNEVYVSAKRQFDQTRSGRLSIRFPASIDSIEHVYNEKSGIYISYNLTEEFPEWTEITPYPGVYGSGTVDLKFNKDRGTFSANFNLNVQNDSSEPELKAVGSFRNVEGLEHQ